MEHYNRINRVMLNFLTREIKETNTSSVWRFVLIISNPCITNHFIFLTNGGKVYMTLHVYYAYVGFSEPIC